MWHKKQRGNFSESDNQSVKIDLGRRPLLCNLHDDFYTPLNDEEVCVKARIFAASAMFLKIFAKCIISASEYAEIARWRSCTCIPEASKPCG